MSSLRAWGCAFQKRCCRNLIAWKAQLWAWRGERLSAARAEWGVRLMEIRMTAEGRTRRKPDCGEIIWEREQRATGDSKSLLDLGRLCGGGQAISVHLCCSPHPRSAQAETPGNKHLEQDASMHFLLPQT